ncbi:MAG: VanZ family protein [Janthinobacterium lividum]
MDLRRHAPLIRVLFVAALAFALFMAFVPHPPGVAEVNDKAQHSLAFVVLSVLAAYGWPDVPLPRIAERLSFVGALIEVVQSIPALHRDCDIMDWLTDTAAIIVALLIVRLVRGRRATR